MYVLGLPGTLSLLLSNLRTTKMNDDVLAIVVSPDAKYIVLALLDCAVKEEKEKRLEEMFESTLTMQKAVCTQGRTPEEGAWP
ncbi:hypothetical protein Pint_31701 [Pistacia integerrima]|uniref:Uncharacterized protein n=1 Tax=Pistacia integerrima TaxID=434235 RepID=A0ACC0XRT2_9ROSI|nr:hypothetical protein Pint_31701 [Pistacia integerrima]